MSILKKRQKKKTSHLYVNDWFKQIKIYFSGWSGTSFYSHSIVAGGLELMS